MNWVSTDKVNVHGAVYTVTPGTKDATTATLTYYSETAPEAVGGKYYAVYPSTIAFNTSTQTITLPATQTYDATANGIGNVPMVAVSETKELQFKNICAVLAVKVASGTVKAIKVMADKKNLSGDFTLDPSTSAITATTTGSNTVVLDCGEGVSADNTTFYIAIPPQEYSSLQIYLSADGSTYKEAMATKVPAGLGTLARNKIYPITYAKNAVQLWADGPYFATMNVGETAVGGKTAKYAWGATSADGDPNAETNNNAGTYDLDHDTAYKIWGSAWRMPTQAEFEAMSSNCSLDYNSGFIFKGKNGYNSAKVSFPGEYVGQSVTAQYWTSSVAGDGNVYHGEFQLYQSGDTSFECDGGSKPVVDNSTVYKYFVRAVLATPAAAPAPTPAPTSNLLPGEFSVSPTKKVKFTKGNLWCNASVSPATFAFEEHQYDFPTSYPTLSGDNLWNCDHVGHFFWKKWEVYSSTDDYAYRDMPYYATCGTGTTSTTDVFWCGEAHPLEVAGTQGLYVLSADEWNYLLNEEDNGGRSGNRYALAKYKDKYGIIIFPDGYTGTTSGDGIGEVNNAWNETNPSANIPDDTWTAMEAAGVVFLPSAGYRNQETITGGYCRYWSSTPYDVTTENKYLQKAYCLNVINYSTNQSSLWSKGKEQRNYGSSIRLVKTVE